MHYNYQRLRGLIREHCGTQQKFANKIGISTMTLSQRLNGKLQFTQKEMEDTMAIFELSNENIPLIFFESSIRKTVI